MPPHFHAFYGEFNGLFGLNKLEMLEGDLPNRAKNLVCEWAEKNQDMLLKMWDTQELQKLEGLE